jgi:hypothetical protein
MKAKTKITFLFVTLLFLAIAASCNLPRLNSVSTPSIVTNTFIAGDLGWGTIHGKVTGAGTGTPIVGATVTCQHSSHTSTTLCNTSVVTAEGGTYAFPESFFHDTDRVQLEVKARGFTKQTINVNFLTSPWLNIDVALVAIESPQVVCTQPSCGPYDSRICPQGDCAGGCGYVCITPVAICTPPLCAIGVSEVYFCPEVCPAGCGTTCATFTPAP